MRIFKVASDRLWGWYEKHETLNVGIAAVLFLLQLVHLFWLTADVVLPGLFGFGFFHLEGVWQFLIIVVDYLEIPTLVSVSFVYLNELHKAFSWKSVIYLLFLNSQWLHIFWITDEFVVGRLQGASGVGLPLWFAWVAIFIDYLELPVIYDTTRKFLAQALKLTRNKAQS